MQPVSTLQELALRTRFSTCFYPWHAHDAIPSRAMASQLRPCFVLPIRPAFLGSEHRADRYEDIPGTSATYWRCSAHGPPCAGQAV